MTDDTHPRFATVSHEAARGVACTSDKANNLKNLHCIERETKPTYLRLAIAAVCSDRSWMQMSVQYIRAYTCNPEIH